MNSTQASKSGKDSIMTAEWRVILRPKPLMMIVGTVIAAACLWGLWMYLTHPPRPWLVRWQVSRYLRKNSVPGIFKVNFAFPSKAEMAEAPPENPAKPQLTKGARTGKGFDTLAHEYIDLKTSALMLEREVPQSEAELNDVKPRLEQLTKELAEARIAGATNIGVMQTQVKALQVRVAALEKRVANKSTLQKNEEALGPILADLLEFQKAWEEEMQAPAVVGAGKLRNAMAEFTSEIQSKLQLANSYAAIYQVIGERLWVAGRLLDSANPEHRRNAMLLAVDASRNALNDAENGWLAARICEGYLLPYLELANESNRRSPLNYENLLRHCADNFGANLESQNVLRTYEVALARAKTQLAADTAREQLAMKLEQAGDYKTALKYMREIKLTNDFRGVLRRIPRLERLAKGQ